jgi:hypothetical protein
MLADALAHVAKIGLLLGIECEGDEGNSRKLLVDGIK